MQAACSQFQLHRPGHVALYHPALVLHPPVVSHIQEHQGSHIVPSRDVVAFGRNDGNSSARKKAARKKSEQKRRQGGDVGIGNAWWEDDNAVQQVASQSVQNSTNRTSSSQQHVSATLELEEKEEDTTGWWEKQEERTLQAYAPSELNDAQVKRLELAYAAGRRKMKVTELAQELGLAREEVLHWVKQFALKPDSERQKIIASRVSEQQRQQEAASQHPLPRHMLTGSGQFSGLDAARRAAEEAQPGPQQAKNAQGFIPFYTRKEMGLTDFKTRRLSADIVRTLESIYARTPFPPDDVIKGMWDLHRVNRETVLGWLQARRAQDGINSSEQKRNKQKDVLNMTPAKLREAMGNVAFDSDNMLVQLAAKQAGQDLSSGAAAATGQEGAAAAAPPPPAQPTFVQVTKAQLAQIKSSLPSPNKFKGKKRAEAMEIAATDTGLKVGDIQYVVKEASGPASVKAGGKWKAMWRARKAAQPSKLLTLIFEERLM